MMAIDISKEDLLFKEDCSLKILAVRMLKQLRLEKLKELRVKNTTDVSESGKQENTDGTNKMLK